MKLTAESDTVYGHEPDKEDLMAGPRSHLFGHRWSDVAGDWNPPYGGTPVTLICDDCGMERRDAFGDNTGKLVYRRYLDHNGYRRRPDEPKMTTADLRLQWIEQHITEARKTRKQSKRQQLAAVT